MAVGTCQLHNDSLSTLVTESGTQWDTGTFAFALLGNGYTQSDAHTNWSQLSAQEIGDVDYAQIAVTGKTLDKSGNSVKFGSAVASFGTNVTIEAKFLACVAGTAGALAGGDKVIWTLDLNTASGSSTIAKVDNVFVVRQSETTHWFSIGQV